MFLTSQNSCVFSQTSGNLTITKVVYMLNASL